jgi:hypothetical protein
MTTRSKARSICLAAALLVAGWSGLTAKAAETSYTKYESKDPRVKRLRTSCAQQLAGAKQYFDLQLTKATKPGYDRAVLGDLSGVWGSGNYHDILPTLPSTESMIRWTQGASRAGRSGGVYIFDVERKEYCHLSDMIFQFGALIGGSVGLQEFGSLAVTKDDITLTPYYSVAAAGNPSDNSIQVKIYPNKPRTYSFLTVDVQTGWFPNLIKSKSLGLQGPDDPYVLDFSPKRVRGPKGVTILLRAK